ncbi:MAG: nicotinate-nucleotide adenylyltransferase [Gammaproteobacteria bacterium]|nr:nicotinate-nucleotide adenylyltransferase [Gammaproteobacteria bacterium]
MPIGILGGTFDPVHFGHLRAALEVLQDMELDEVRVIPSHTPPHRAAPVASPDQRLRMVQAAVEGVTGLRVDRRELDRGGISYTVDTLLSLHAETGVPPLCLILGTDAFCGLGSWHRWRELPSLCHFVVVQRPGWEPPRDGAAADLLRAGETRDPAQLKRAGGGQVLRHTVTQLDVSASRIRTAIQAGKSPRFLLPDAVWRLIQTEGLYR